ATFIPEIPYTLIEVLTSPGAVVYDPFAGIGTTLFQALLLGRLPVGSEICTVSVWLIKSFWTLLNPRTNLMQVANDLSGVETSYDADIKYCRRLTKSEVLVDRLRPWFNPEPFNQLMYLRAYEDKLRSAATKAAMRIALSATLKAVCAQDEGWGCIADNVLPKPDQVKKPRNALERFRRNMNLLLRDMGEIQARLPALAKDFLRDCSVEDQIKRLDVRRGEFPKDETVDLVVTSPPYPNMTDYSTSQRLSYYLLGKDPGQDLPEELGARRRRFSASAIEDYRTGMRAALEVICRKLKPGGYICLVMPKFNADNHNNTIRKQVVQECLGFLHTNGCTLEQELSRILPKRRRHHNQKWISLEKESIHVFRKLQ
ncbi:MAG: DNA methyltransferase, partial [Candidatus Acidiferrum sp.]